MSHPLLGRFCHPLRGGLRAILVLIAVVAAVAGACAAAAPAIPAAGTPAPGAPQPGDDSGRGGDRSGEPVADQGTRDGALIVYTGRMKLEVAQIGPAVEAATQLIADLGGYVQGSEFENVGAREAATVTFRIPAARWDEALRGLRGQAQRVVNEYTESSDVTAEVVDLDARITNLRASEAALQEIMTRAGTIDDVLKVQRELTNVRGQIEQLTGRRDYLQRQAAHGTLVVQFQTTVVAAEVAQEGWQLGAEIDRAVADLIRIGQRLASVAIWLGIVALPVLLPIGLVVYIAYRLRRRFTPGTPPGSTG